MLGQMLCEAMYIMLVAILVINFTIAWFMDLLNIGEAKILAPIIGTAIGWLILRTSPTTMAGLIVGAIMTIISDLVLYHLIYPKL